MFTPYTSTLTTTCLAFFLHFLSCPHVLFFVFFCLYFYIFHIFYDIYLLTYLFTSLLVFVWFLFLFYLVFYLSPVESTVCAFWLLVDLFSYSFLFLTFLFFSCLNDLLFWSCCLLVDGGCGAPKPVLSVKFPRSWSMICPSDGFVLCCSCCSVHFHNYNIR